MESERTIRTTFEHIGLRNKKNIANKIAIENTYDSNLLSDISSVDYCKNNIGKTILQKLDGIPTFVDDLYVYGYLAKEDVVENKGKLLATTGDCGMAKIVIGNISVKR